MDWDVYMTRPDGSYLNMKVRELLPLGFSPEQLDEPRIQQQNGGGIGILSVAGDNKMASKIQQKEPLVNGNVTESSTNGSEMPTLNGVHN